MVLWAFVCLGGGCLLVVYCNRLGVEGELGYRGSTCRRELRRQSREMREAFLLRREPKARRSDFTQ